MPDPNPRHPSVAIVGGGVIGLAVGCALARRGAAVDLYERGEAGRGASWAAAGMLAAGVEHEPGEAPLLALARRSQAQWPAFAAELGQDVGYRGDGTLAVAATRDDASALRHAADYQRSRGVPLRWLTGGELRALEPHLAPGLVAGVLSPGDHQVDTRRLVPALITAFAASGGRLHEGGEAALEVQGGRAVGVRTDRLRQADQVVVAAGAWTPDLPGLPASARPPVRPVKGQILALRMDAAAPLLRHVVRLRGGYLVPRRDGRLLVGATVEERGFDRDLTAGGVLSLLDMAWRALPATEDLAVDEMWTGVRPGSPDDAPILGPTPVPGLQLATGHFRNGILLAPVTAAALAASVLDGGLPDWAQPFALTRFAQAAA